MKLNISKNGLVAQLFNFGIGPIVGMGISMLTVPITTRLLMPEEFGRASLFSLVQTLFSNTALLGMDMAYVRYYNQINIDKQNLFFNATFLPLCVSFLAGVLISFFAKPVSIFVFESYEPLLVYSFCILLPAIVLQRFAMMSIRMSLRGKTYSFLNIISQILNFFILLFLLLVCERSFRSVVLASILVTIFATLLSFVLSGQHFKVGSFFIDKELLRNLLLFGLPLMPGYMLSWVMNSFDKTALRLWSSFNEIGLYAAAFKIVSILAMIQMIFKTAWMPVSYKWYEEGVGKKKFESVFLLLMAGMVLLFFFVMIFRNVILLFLGEAYRNTDYIFVFLLFSPVLNVMADVSGLGMQFKKKTIFSLYVSLISAAANVLMDFLLVPKHGALGAAIATCVCEIFYFFSRSFFSRKLWIKINLLPFEINLVLMLLYAFSILLWQNYVIEIAFFIIGFSFNGAIILNTLRKRSMAFNG